MPRRLRQVVKDNIEKCRAAAVAAVDVYNRPGPRFRTAYFVVMINLAWTALFHAIFYARNQKPWYREKDTRRVRYVKVDGEPKHWDLAACLTRYYDDEHPPERLNLEFLLGLRNKIEHRHLPELDASLYGECQAALMNLEEMLVQQFGRRYALTEQLAVSLQFSQTIPTEKKTAAQTLARREARSVASYTEKFRGTLPSTGLNSMKYSFNVYLVPRVVNRENAADAAVQFVHVNEASRDELERLSRLNVLIKEKHIPIANLELFRPQQVVNEVCGQRPHSWFTIGSHTAAWKRHGVRPATGSANRSQTDSRYCVYDPAHNDYLYTKAWIDLLVKELDAIWKPDANGGARGSGV